MLQNWDYENPTGCLLGACSGRQPVGYGFSLLAAAFRSLFPKCNP